jgi:hypothetical protein
MSGIMRQILTCHWAGRRIERYLDADPSAPLTAEEVARLEAHLATCERCARLAAQHRVLHRALSLWPGPAYVDPAAVIRVRSFLDDLTDGRTT